MRISDWSSDVCSSDLYQLVEFTNSEWQPRIDELTRQMVEIFRPFDYGRYEFRLDLETGEVRMLEVNLNCNLWSEKVYGQRLQEQLIETILCERSEEHTSELQSLMRI